MNKWMNKLMKLDGALTDRRDPFLSIIDTPSPSVNFIFGNSWGLPMGYTAMLYGPPKGGKTVLTNMFTGKLMKDDPEAMVVKFDTEYRTEGQLTEKSAQMFGIDYERLVPYQTNIPSQIFDRITKDVADMCQDGAPIKLVIIDSLYGIQGRRTLNSDTVDKQQIGDHALTIQDGLKRVLDVQRKYRFAMLLVDQVRAEMDPIEQMRGNKFKMRSSLAVQHQAEYFIAVEQNASKDGRSDINGNEFLDESVTDLSGKGDTTGSKIKVKMKKSSMGPFNRSAEFTFDFKKGVINVHEEVFKLGTNRGVIEKPNQVTYSFQGKTWKGKESMLQALQESPELQAAVIVELKKRDLAGDFAKYDSALEQSA